MKKQKFLFFTQQNAISFAELIVRAVTLSEN